MLDESGEYFVKNMKRVCLTILMVGILTSCNMLPVEKEILEPPTVKEYEKKDFKLVSVQRDTLKKEVYIRGEFLAAQRQDLFFEKGDMVLKDIYVAQGDTVTQGDLIIETENEELEEKLEDKLQEIEKIKLTIQQYKHTQEIAVNKQQQLLDEYTKQLNRATDLEKQLGDKNYVYTKSDMDQLKEKVDSQNEVVEKLFLQHKIENEKIQSQLEIASIELENIQQQYDETKICSNISGEVTFVKEFEQQDKTVPKEVLVTIMDKSSSLFRVEPNDYKKFSIGDTVEIQCNKQNFIGQVIDPVGVVSAENIKQNAYYITVEDLPVDIKEGTSGKIFVLLGQAENVLYLPKGAINNANGESFVYTYDNEVKQKCIVKTGFQTDYMVEITNGLKEGQVVVVQ